MNKLKCLLLAVSVALLSGCSSFSNPLASNGANSGKLERVGVLLVQNCVADSQCVEFSLFESDLQTRRVALSGRIDEALDGQLIAILGTGSGGENGMELIQVEQTRAITQFDYKPFLDKSVADYVQNKYGCTSLWDQSYAWRLDARQPLLIASLSNPIAPDTATIQLEFDGLTKALLAVNSEPENANPCQLR